ncbi:DUF4097 family beta strand repeat-containing protein [Thalassobacillus hwangdonensis]|uniref:DUF4097 domain-containing protein n=1 Tax=Thalassobacillus hwangdonensis TaxID=546108 RepID=A0ABW3L2Z0_9BACI
MDEKRIRILKKIEEGSLSAEEGAELLEAADAQSRHEKQDGSVSTKVDWDQGAQQKTKEKTKKKKSIMTYVEDAFHKIKNVDLDLNFGDHVSVSHIYHTEDTFKQMDIQISNGGLELKSWNEASVRLECEAKVYQTDDQDEARKRFLKETDFKLEDGTLLFASPSKKLKTDVVIYVPKGDYEEIHSKLFNGSITASELNCREFNLKTTNGSITMEGLRGDECDAETSNGSIRAKQSAFDDFEADTVNGSVKLSGDFGKVDASAVTGSVSCEYYGKKAHTGFFQTTTGSVRVKVPENVRVDGKLQTSMGSIKCDIDDAKIYKEKKEMIRKELYFVINENYEQAYHLEAETKTGSVKVE